ncbi:hypothetical protein [Streptacidiphilus sp. P02-A3a]|uniref:hypothetical protein n=1 Tax=Streptacidiphilus sp. P02-A3a TaxID=2704468 RepID=UPI0015F9A534|nr:hypothetical protein [Streptacidiphilus sp. P02-A3a]QMU70422.1 hypothetical protein GXP74_21620 [Streptacidiphilus sp. P02-A3a]
MSTAEGTHGGAPEQGARRWSTALRTHLIKPLAVCALAAAALAPVNAYAAPSGAAAPSARPASVVVVTSGQRLDLGHGQWLTLTAAQVCDGSGPTVEKLLQRSPTATRDPARCPC